MSQIRAIVYQGPGNATIEDRQLQDAPPGHVVVRATRVGITNDDIHAYLAAPRAATDGSDTPPPRRLSRGTVLGTEAVGLVIGVGEGVSSLHVDDRVSIDPAGRCGVCMTCRSATGTPCNNEGWMGIDRDGALADAVVVRAVSCHLVPADVTDDDAVLVHALAHAFRALRKSGLRVGDDIVVFGADDYGLAVVAQAVGAGANRVIAVDPFPARRSAAIRLGATSTIDPLTADPVEVIRGELPVGPDVIFVSLESYSPSASMFLVQAYGVMRLAASVVVIRAQGGQGFDELVHDRLATPLSKEARLRFVGPAAAAEPLHGGVPRGDWALTLERLATGAVDLCGLSPSTVPWSSLRTGTAVDEVLRTLPSATPKTLIRMDA